MTSLTARWHRSINEIPEQQWNSLVGDAAIPFYRWSWLEALESSGSIIPEQGWQPLHLALWRDDIPIAVAPLFLKGHSYGEFVFDQTFARLAADLGLRYYPKLLGGRFSWLPCTNAPLPAALAQPGAWQSEGVEDLGDGEWLVRYRRIRSG